VLYALAVFASRAPRVVAICVLTHAPQRVNGLLAWGLDRAAQPPAQL